MVEKSQHQLFLSVTIHYTVVHNATIMSSKLGQIVKYYISLISSYEYTINPSWKMYLHPHSFCLQTFYHDFQSIFLVVDTNHWSNQLAALIWQGRLCLTQMSQYLDDTWSRDQFILRSIVIWYLKPHFSHLFIVFIYTLFRKFPSVYTSFAQIKLNIKLCK